MKMSKDQDSEIKSSSTKKLSTHFSKRNIIGFKKQVKMRNNIQIIDAERRIRGGPSID